MTNATSASQPSSADADANADAATPPAFNDTADDCHCPLCEYNLYGLIEPRCPECGYTFTWKELRDPAIRHHPYLFEHHPRRNVWSFWKTLTLALQPHRFWRTLHPAQPSSVPRLLLYMLACLAPLCVVAAMMYLYEFLSGSVFYTRFSGRDLSFWLSILPNLEILWPVAAVAIYPLLLFAALQAFRLSMRRSKVRAIHVLRCVVYSSDVLFWAAMVWIAYILVQCLTPAPRAYILWTGVRPTQLLPAAVLVAVTSWRLAVAYRTYLRFHWPWVTILSAQATTLAAIALWFALGRILLLS